MEVQELNQLADWYNLHYDRLNQLYQNLIAPVQNNANQASKQPLTDQFNALVEYLSNMDFDTLSIQQIKQLEKLVGGQIGHTGASFVESIVRNSSFDAVTALAELNAAFSQITNTKNYFDSYQSAVASLKFIDLENEEEPDRVTVRVGFQKDAAINNMVDWRDSSKEWHLIIYGIALAVDEPVENTHIVGATKGSIILILKASAAVASLMAVISKSLTSVAKDVIEIGHDRENLRHKGRMNETMEQQFELMIAEKRASAEQIVLEDIRSRLPQIATGGGDKVNALSVSVKNLLEFNEQGGNVDFVAPEPTEEGSEGEPNSGILSAEFARKAIHEYQEVREQLKMITDRRPA
jgi:hypothetical protein